MALTGDYFTDWRRDPIDNSFYPEEITAEPNNVVIISGTNGRRGFYLIEVPSPDFPVTITRTHIVDGSGNIVPDPSPPIYTQVSGNPSSGEYAVNFERGLIILNSDEYNNTYQKGSIFNVAYYGLGSQMNVRNTLYIEISVLNTKLSVNGSLPMTGNLNLGNQKIISLLSGTAPNDAVNKSQLDLKVSKSGDSMTGSLAMGNNKITGLANGTAPNDAVNYSQLVSSSFFGVHQQSGSAGTNTVTAEAKLYDFFSSGGGTFIYDITGLNDINGTIFFVYCVGSIPTLTAQTVEVKINGTTIFADQTSNGGNVSPLNYNYIRIVFKHSGTWFYKGISGT
jgi:hypothetical protein